MTSTANIGSPPINKVRDMKYRDLYVSSTPDCDENEGGYYCQVYLDEDMEYEIDDFCIHPEELAANPNVEHWMKEYIDENDYCYKDAMRQYAADHGNDSVELTTL